MNMLLCLLVLVLLLHSVNSQSIYSTSIDNDHSLSNEKHERFILTSSLLFNSNTRRRHATDHDIINEHERILRNLSSSSLSSSIQSSFVINLQENCGSKCHNKVSNYLSTISPSSSSVFRPSSSGNGRYNVINVDKALVLASLHNIESLLQRYPYYVRGYTPLLAVNKIDIDTYDIHHHAKNCINNNSNITITFSIIIVIAPLDITELDAFTSKLLMFKNISLTLFSVEYEGLLPNKRSNIMLSFFDCNPIDDLLYVLSEFNEVLWIEALPHFEAFTRYSRSICKSDVTNQF